MCKDFEWKEKTNREGKELVKKYRVDKRIYDNFYLNPQFIFEKTLFM